MEAHVDLTDSSPPRLWRCALLGHRFRPASAIVRVRLVTGIGVEQALSRQQLVSCCTRRGCGELSAGMTVDALPGTTVEWATVELEEFASW
jgi:hypothetical protein